MTTTLESRKYIRRRKNKKQPEIDISLELAPTPVERPVVKISERPVMRLHKLREDFEKIAKAIDNCFETLVQGTPADLNAIITFMQKQVQLLDKVVHRVPEKYIDLKDSITAFQTKTQSSISVLETMAERTRAAITDYETMTASKAPTLQL